MKSSMVAISVAVVVCPFGAFGTSALLTNGDFEDGDAGWSLPCGQWRVESGSGMEKSSALVFEIGKDVKAEAIRWAETRVAARFPVEGGGGYRFEGWLKTDGLTILRGGDLALGFAAYDANGKCVKSSTAVCAADNRPDADGWDRSVLIKAGRSGSFGLKRTE